MRRRLWGWILLLAGAGSWTARAQNYDWFEAGPFVSEFQSVWETGWRAEAFGTFAWWETVPDTHRWGLAPIFSYESTPVLERERFDLFYPVVTWQRTGTEYRWQLVQLFNFSGANRQSDDSVVRRSLFPIFFQQTSRSATNDYLAVLPFYGHLENRLFRDDIKFYMFPIFATSRKGDMVTRNYFYPVFHRRTGPGWHGWQFWPLYGTDHKEVTWKTNTLGDRVVSPGREKWFALWPIVLSDTQGIGTPAAVTNRAVLPFYATSRSTARDQTSVLWPLFSRTEDRAKNFVEWGAPWPIIGWANGPGKTARRVFPFYGHIQGESLKQEFFMWPIYTHRAIHDEVLQRDHWRSFMFLYDDTRLRNLQTGEFRREAGVWPLVTWRHDLDGRERLQIPAPFETVLRNREGVERNYSPIWAVYRAERNPKTGQAFQSVAWNLFRRDVSTNTVRTSCIFGLVQTLRTDERRHWRLFWLPNRNFTGGSTPAVETGRSPRTFAVSNPYPKRGDVLAERQLSRRTASAVAQTEVEVAAPDIP